MMITDNCCQQLQLLKLADQGDIESKFELSYRLAFGG